MLTKRESGILMPLSSLPGGYGIGSLGAPARRFVDFLVRAGQQIWQILPINPTGYGDSPYQSCSAFAGNPYFIDLDLLASEGLLSRADYAFLDWGKDPEKVDYGLLYQKRLPILRKAYRNFMDRRPLPGCDTPFPDDWYAFTFRSDGWLPDYCMYMAIKQANGMKDWQQWPRPLRLRDPDALEAFCRENADEISFWSFVQYEFDKQWQALKSYANSRGVRIMGDIPIYVAADSADAWAGGRLFEMDAEGHPRRVAGCPPDYFSADGQLWGNPLYDWAYHKRTGYAWWISRVRHALNIYDLLRIDHFRGFDTYWAIPAGEPTARRGKWENGPGMDLFHALKTSLGNLPIVAEDLGEMFDSVRQLLKESGFPGMKVLQFAFDGTDNDYLPHNCQANSVCYAGTHDNNTLMGWWTSEATAAQRDQITEYLALTPEEGPRLGILRGVLASPSRLAVVSMADWLGLDESARMNTPGKADGNWQWRAAAGALTSELAAEIRTMTLRYFRTAPRRPAASPAARTDAAEKESAGSAAKTASPAAAESAAAAPASAATPKPAGKAATPARNTPEKMQSSAEKKADSVQK